MTDNIGTRLKAIRKAKGMTQRQIADLAEMSTSYYTEIERGTKRPSLDRYDRIAEALGVSVSHLLDQDGKSTHSSPDLLSQRIGTLPLSDQTIILRVLEGLEASNRGRDGRAI